MAGRRDLSLASLDVIVDDQGLRHVPEPELVQLGDRILQLFRDMRPLYTPGRVGIGRKALPHFYRAAELCRGRGIPPEQFVREQLDGMSLTGIFWPSGIASQVFRDLLPPSFAANALATKLYKSMLQIFMERSRIYGPRQVLGDETVQLSPLFIAVISHHHGYDDLVDQHREGARIELAATPAARDVFGDLAEFLNDD